MASDSDLFKEYSNLAGLWEKFQIQVLLVQEIPDATKQAKWDGPKPDKFDWDKEIKRVVEEGKEVPEIEWLKPGEDAAWEVGSAPCANLRSILPRHRLLFKILQLPCNNKLPFSTRGLSRNESMLIACPSAPNMSMLVLFRLKLQCNNAVMLY